MNPDLWISGRGLLPAAT